MGGGGEGGEREDEAGEVVCGAEAEGGEGFGAGLLEDLAGLEAGWGKAGEGLEVADAGFNRVGGDGKGEEEQ